MLRGLAAPHFLFPPGGKALAGSSAVLERVSQDTKYGHKTTSLLKERLHQTKLVT